MNSAVTCNLTHSEEFSTGLIEWLRGEGSIHIVNHDYPDPDTLAAAFALQQLILIKTGQEASFVLAV